MPASNRSGPESWHRNRACRYKGRLPYQLMAQVLVSAPDRPPAGDRLSGSYITRSACPIVGSSIRRDCVATTLCLLVLVSVHRAVAICQQRRQLSGGEAMRRFKVDHQGAVIGKELGSIAGRHAPAHVNNGETLKNALFGVYFLSGYSAILNPIPLTNSASSRSRPPGLPVGSSARSWV